MIDWLTWLLGLLWLAAALRVVTGIHRLPDLKDYAEPPSPPPMVSLVFAARDEEKTLAPALESMLGQDYPAFEVIAVEDRSQDGTGRILEAYSADYDRLRVLRIEELPPGWLGKTHALARGAELARGDWLLFTDADVHFSPELLRRAIALASERRLSHLSLIGLVVTHGFWERVAISFFQLAGMLRIRPWEVADRQSKAYLGVGMFQLVSRQAYLGIGTHRRLALEVVDDLALGRVIKEEGFSSEVGLAVGHLKIRWQEGLGGIARGLSKNLFATLDYRLSRALGSLSLLLILDVFPFLAMGLGESLLPGLLTSLVIAGLHGWCCRWSGVSPLYGFTHPLGALILAGILSYSTILTLWQGGVWWRGTFYPLDLLRGRGAGG